MIYTKQQIRQMITQSYLADKPIIFPFDDLKHPFGFKRVDGETILFIKGLIPSRTEEQIQMAPRQEIIKNVQDWAKAENVPCYYDIQKDSFYFY